MSEVESSYTMVIESPLISEAKDLNRPPTPSSKSVPVKDEESSLVQEALETGVIIKAPPKKRVKKEKPPASESTPSSVDDDKDTNDQQSDTPKKATTKPRKKASSSIPKKEKSMSSASLASLENAAPNASSSGAGTGTPDSKAANDKGGKDKEFKEKPVGMTPAQKKRYALLESNLKEELAKQADTKSKLDILNKRINTIKWPVRDNLVLSKLLAVEEKKPPKEQKTALELQKPLPPPQVTLPLDDQTLASDALACWDFMNLFDKQLELAHMSLDEFIDLLQYRGQDSIALVELFMAPLRVLVYDEQLCAKMSLDIPFETNFARKVTAAELQVGPLGSVGRMHSKASGNVLHVGMDFESNCGDSQAALTSVNTPSVGPSSVTQALVDEHRLYSKQVSLLPRKLRHDQVDPLRWQAVCAAILPHLPPVRAFLKLSLELQHLITDPVVLKANKALANNSTLSGKEMSNTSQRQREKEAKKIQEELKEAQTRMKMGGVCGGMEQVSNFLVQSNISHRSRDINIDSALCITSDVTESLNSLRDAMTALHSGDLHKTTPQNKLFILKMLFKACYATQVFIDAIDTKAEVLIQKTADRKREMYEMIKDKRSGTKLVQERAIELCKAENKILFEEKEKAAAEKAAKAAERLAKIEEKKIAAGENPKKDSKKKGGVKCDAEGEGKKTGDGPETGDAAATTGKDTTENKDSKTKKVTKVKTDPYYPAPTQLAAKIEELLFYEEIGIDDVHDLGDDTVSDDEAESEVVEVDGVAVVLGGVNRQRGFASRTAAAEREEKRKAVVLRNELRASAKENLAEAIDSGRESDLKRAIKQGQRGELLQWEEEDGKIYCTSAMLQAQRMLVAIETRIKSEKEDADFQRTMKEYQVRTEPLGSDRYGNTYWAFNGDENRLYVCLAEDEKIASDAVTTESSLNSSTVPALSSSSSSSSSSFSPSKNGTSAGAGTGIGASTLSSFKKINVPINSEVAVLQRDPSLNKLYQRRPYREYGDKWQVYGSERDIYYLWAALDDRGINERALREKIRSSFNFDFSPPVVYETDHDWVGREIERVWPKQSRLKNSFGVIDGWLKEDKEEGDEPLWHIQYPDGDSEELDENEVKRFLISDDSKTEAEKVEAKNLAAAMSLARQDGQRGSSRVAEVALNTFIQKKAAMTIANAADADDTESDDEDDAPNVVLTYDNKDTTRSYMHRVTKAGYFGFNGLKSEMRKFLTVIEDGLKKADVKGFTKESKAILRKCLESSYTVEALRDVLLNIEAAVIEHASESAPINDAVVARAEQEEAHKELRNRGWNFDAESEEIVGILGKSARRFFLRTGASDGVITGVYRSIDNRTNITTEIYRLEHADGDVEEIDVTCARVAIQAYDLNQMSDVTAATREELDADGNDDDDSDNEDEGYDERDIEDMTAELEEQQLKMWTIEAEEDPEVECIPILWPTQGVRTKWLQALENATCVADVALAMSAFHAQAVSFGVTGESPFELAKERSPSDIFKKPKLLQRNRDGNGRPIKASASSKNDGSKKSHKRKNNTMEDQNARPSRKASRETFYGE